jgi:hypothetical protein
MIDAIYLKRRAVQEALLASNATDRRAAAAHDAIAAAYFLQVAALAEVEDRRLDRLRPPQL